MATKYCAICEEGDLVEKWFTSQADAAARANAHQHSHHGHIVDVVAREVIE